MCGKFTQMASWANAREYADLFKATVNDNVRVFTPRSAVPVLHLDDDGARIMSPMTWGFSEDRYAEKRFSKNMHARGETVDVKPKWREAFKHRRGVTWAHTFNEGEEVPTYYDDGTPTGKTWTRQWTIKRKDGRPLIIGVIYDAFDVGRGLEYEFVQITTEPNELIARITDRMLFLLNEDDLELWLGQLRAPIEDVKALIKTYEFDPDEWDISVEDPTKKPPRPRKPKGKSPPDQADLF